MTDPIERFLTHIPPLFLRNLLEQMDAAFAKALRLTNEHYAEPERAGMLGQSRHACCEEGFRRAAQDAGLEARAPHTQPAGGRYSLVERGGVYLVRGNVQRHCGTPRPSQFRRALAELNAWLEPIQWDFLRVVPDPPSDKLCGMLVVTADRRLGDPSLPAYVGIGVPNRDLSDWLMLESLNKLLARHHDRDTKTHKPAEPSICVKDRAVPRLKKKPGGNESN
jgi:hypothetical protein